MASLIIDLIDVLNEQLSNLHDMLGLSEEKKDVLIQNNLEQLQLINNLENTLINRNNKFDKQIVQLISDIALVLNLNGSITLTTIANSVNSPEKEQLLDIIGDLSVVLPKLQETNAQNRKLIEHSLDYIDFTVNLYSSATVQEPTYSSPKSDLGASKFFDVKQ